MYRNYLRIVIQSLRKNKLFTIINTLGLSVALAVAFLIVLFVVNELSYNRCHQKKDKVYRVLNYYTEFKMQTARTPYVLASTLKQDFPQIEKATQAIYVSNVKLKFNDEYLTVNNVVATDSEIFDIFTLPLVSSQSDQRLLDDQNSIVISNKLANKFFPGQDPVGKEIAGEVESLPCVFTIKGVFKDIPKNSSFWADCLVNSKWSISPINKAFGSTNAEEKWDFNFWETWVLLKEGTQPESINTQFKDFALKHVGDLSMATYSLQNLGDVYLRSEEVINVWEQGNMKNIRLFSLIAFIIVLVATINYVLLSTAVSTARSKEIGIRKTFGASGLNIKKQLYLESVLLAMLALPISIAMASIALPYAEELFQTKLLIINSNVIIYILTFLSITILIGLFSGIYSAGYLSRLKVISILKNYVTFGKNKSTFRSFLIVAQLIIFCTFVSSALIIRSQYNYFLSKDPGYYTDNTILIDLYSDFKEYTPYLNAVKSNPNVIMAAGVMRGLPSQSSMSIMIPSYRDKNTKVMLEGMTVDYAFLETMGIPLLEGRYFSEEFGNDMKNSVILNETAVKQLEVEDPLGKVVGSKTVIGVVKDFNLHSLESDIPPLFISMTSKYIRQIAVHYRPGSLKDLLPYLESEWKKVAGDKTFEYSTIKDITKTLYESQEKLSSIVTFAAIFTLLISMSGLFGLTLFVVRSRTKEIGIRKVMGSSEKSIIYSVLKKNLLEVFIAAVISFPMTYYIMNQWLSKYAYRITIDGWFFAYSFGIAIAVVVLTVIALLLKVARTNPVESLRYE